MRGFEGKEGLLLSTLPSVVCAPKKKKDWLFHPRLRPLLTFSSILQAVCALAD